MAAVAAGMNKHVAIFAPPFLDLLLNGSKTIESRFSKVRCAPFGTVAPGDVVLIKRSGGPVVGEFTIRRVEQWADPGADDRAAIAAEYGPALAAGADPLFWERRAGCRYITLIWVTKLAVYDRPVPFAKRDRRGWVVLAGCEQLHD